MDATVIEVGNAGTSELGLDVPHIRRILRGKDWTNLLTNGWE